HPARPAPSTLPLHAALPIFGCNRQDDNPADHYFYLARNRAVIPNSHNTLAQRGLKILRTAHNGRLQRIAERYVRSSGINYRGPCTGLTGGVLNILQIGAIGV